jgi:hypothetical protein
MRRHRRRSRRNPLQPNRGSHKTSLQFRQNTATFRPPNSSLAHTRIFGARENPGRGKGPARGERGALITRQGCADNNPANSARVGKGSTQRPGQNKMRYDAENPARAGGAAVKIASCRPNGWRRRRSPSRRRSRPRILANPQVSSHDGRPRRHEETPPASARNHTGAAVKHDTCTTPCPARLQSSLPDSSIRYTLAPLPPLPPYRSHPGGHGQTLSARG